MESMLLLTLSIIVLGGKNANRYVTAKCSCGNVKNIRIDSLWRGDAKSCGCKRGISCGVKFPVNRVSDHILYQVWTDMNRRCYTTTRKDYKHYGGRGIEVCDSWKRGSKEGFLNFLQDMENSFEKGLELERLDTNGNYTPENCAWRSRKAQVNNTRVNHNIKGYGVYLTIEEWNYLLGIEKGLIWDRIVYLGWEADIEELLKVKFKDRRWYFKYCGEVYSAKDLWELLGYSYGKRCQLVNHYGNSEDALIAEGVEFTAVKPREKSNRTFLEGLSFLEKSEDNYAQHLLLKIKEQQEE
ncbi:hypothetical protein VPBG_00193 [Vibrio phage helene 12B3]|uniref:HNH endonuclease n=1 Tax=Vibrio phage helene 12B3 TaxID=573173 RepID=UPI0002C0D88C|nr:HNH endonuclease [Vibrio phage helene 12B3]AGG57965.1 hypothetical protein VPBG_00193 [Vibrio phage helene 12B3]